MKLNIVLTDCSTVTSGDLDLSVLEKFGNVTYYGETAPEQTAERIKDADIVIINKTVIGKDEIDAAKDLKLVALFATGYNNVDTAYARSKGIAVANAGSYSTGAVAQQVFAYILNHASKISAYNEDVKNGEWIRSRLFCFFSRPTCELAGKTLGIFGFGAIGKRVADIARAFDMRVISCTRSKKEVDGVEFVDLDTLLHESDFLTVHCPLTEQTKELFNAEVFAKMKKGVYLINTARGALIDEAALKAALESGQVAGAGVDVTVVEPLPADSPLLSAPNCIITPHIGWAPYEARVRLMNVTVENLKAFLAGKKQNIVNG
jgi:glycerate dehydrogenase